MKFKNYIKESKLEKEIDNWLKLVPDKIIFNQKDITRWKFPSDILISMIKNKNDTVSIIKYTIEGNIGIQIYKDKDKIKIDKI